MAIGSACTPRGVRSALPPVLLRANYDTSTSGSSSDSGSSDGGGVDDRTAKSLDTGLPVTDIRTTDWFYQDVKSVCGRGLMTGVGNGRIL
ncbi:MAG: hypothetical protein HFE83_09720 [Lachnospiraceae bacterium]|nr:hypothetical protein [Lachnospiraceae bacterium]